MTSSFNVVSIVCPAFPNCPRYDIEMNQYLLRVHQLTHCPGNVRPIHICSCFLVSSDLWGDMYANLCWLLTWSMFSSVHATFERKQKKTLLILGGIFNAGDLVLSLKLYCKIYSFLLTILLKLEIFFHLADYHTFLSRLVLRILFHIKRISPIWWFVYSQHLTLIKVIILYGESNLRSFYLVGEEAETFSLLYYQWVLRRAKQTSKVSKFSTFLTDVFPNLSNIRAT